MFKKVTECVDSLFITERALSFRINNQAWLHALFLSIGVPDHEMAINNNLIVYVWLLTLQTLCYCKLVRSVLIFDLDFTCDFKRKSFYYFSFWTLETHGQKLRLTQDLEYTYHHYTPEIQVFAQAVNHFNVIKRTLFGPLLCLGNRPVVRDPEAKIIFTRYPSLQWASFTLAFTSFLQF